MEKLIRYTMLITLAVFFVIACPSTEVMAKGRGATGVKKHKKPTPKPGWPHPITPCPICGAGQETDGGGSGQQGGTYYNFDSMSAMYDYSRNATATMLFSVPLNAGGDNMHGVTRFSNGDFGIIPNTTSDTEYHYRYDANGNMLYQTANMFRAGYYSIVEAKDGSMVAMGRNDNKLYKIDSNGNAALFYGSSANNKSIAQMPNGNIAVLDYGTNKISEISAETGLLVRDLYSGLPPGDDNLDYMSFRPDGTVYVGSTKSFGSHYFYKGSPGGAITQLGTIDYWSHGIIALPNGDIAVADLSSNAVKRYDGTTGEFLGVIASSPNLYAIGLSLSTDGKIYTHSRNGVIELSFPPR